MRRRVDDRTLETARAASVLKRFAADRLVLAMVELTADVLAQQNRWCPATPSALEPFASGYARMSDWRIGATALLVNADERNRSCGRDRPPVTFIG